MNHWRKGGLALAGLLCACAQTPAPTAPLAPQPQKFGAWVLNGCTISAKTTDILLTTQGQWLPKGAQEGKLEIKLVYIPNLTRPPYAQIDALPTPVPIEGSGRHYTLMLPYSPETTGTMLAENLKIRLAYQRLGETGFQEVAIPSQGLFEAIGALSPVCP